MSERAAASATPTVSVICTAKNAAATIAETIESIRAQSLSDWEMVIVDDGSSDATAEIVRAYEARDPRIRLVPTPGIGRAPALNLAVGEARAPLVANIDADDVAHPQRLEIQYRTMQAFPQFVVTGTATVPFYDHDPFDWPRETFPDLVIGPYDVTRELVFGNVVPGTSAMIWREHLLAVGGYPTEGASEDYRLMVRLAERGYRIGQIAELLIARRWHANQHFDQGNRIPYILNSVRIQRQAVRALGASPLFVAMAPLKFLHGLLPVQVRIRSRVLKRRLTRLVGISRPPPRQA